MGKSAIEKYNCGYGMNQRFAYLFEGAPFRFVAFNENDVPQAFELKEHLFFIGTAFQPERSALDGREHALVSSFLSAAAEFR